MKYAGMEQRLKAGEIVILDGGTGTELEQRGVAMDPEAWCGAATLHNTAILEGIHRDYIAAGADVITANTYASSRLILGAAGLADQFEVINRTAVDAAIRARDDSGRNDILIAGSLSHRGPVVAGTAQPDASRAPDDDAMAAAYLELALLLRDAGCDLIILEMMYMPERMHHAFTAAKASGLPVWAGFSARRGADGRVLSFTPHRDIPLEECVEILRQFDVAAAGIMHTQSNVIADALDIVGNAYNGPLLAYPDSGYFASPNWQFENIIPPDVLHSFAAGWIEKGARIVGGCCGLSPAHIAALRPLKNARDT